MPSFDISVAKCVALSILLWRDATPKAQFPPMKELVPIELTRLLGDPSILRGVPGLPAALETGGVARILARNPWDVDARDLLATFKKAVPAPMLEEVQRLIEDRGHKDVVLDMIQYRQRTPTNTKERITSIAQAVCAQLGIRESQEDQVAEAYATVYKDIVRV